MLAPTIIEFELTRERIRVVPLALAEVVKPIEKISDIRIFDTGGMLGRGSRAAPASAWARGSPASCSPTTPRVRCLPSS